MSKHRIPNDKWIEFISEIAIQLTENTYGEDTFETINVWNKDCVVLKEDAQNFYNERYDEIETLLKNTLDIT